jgi:hypothetical protein
VAEGDEMPCYIARCKCGCGALIFACVDEPNASAERKKDTAVSVAEVIEGGYAVERSTVNYARNASWKCSSKGK